MSDGPTLNEQLAALGLTTRPAPRTLYGKEILRGEEVVFAGTAPEVWAWLRESGLIE